MKSYKLAIQYFVIAYLIATVVGFVSFYIHIVVMWIVLFSVMPVIFGYFFYLYLKQTECPIQDTFKETNRLVLFWIVVSFLLDAMVYILVVPLILGYKANWTFFIDQSPWIWLNYLSLFIVGHISRYLFIKNTVKVGG